MAFEGNMTGIFTLAFDTKKPGCTKSHVKCTSGVAHVVFQPPIRFVCMRALFLDDVVLRTIRKVCDVLCPVFLYH